MKVLMISTGDRNTFSKLGVSPFLSEQIFTMRSLGIDVEIFLITERGIKWYLKAILKLNRLIKNQTFDIIHGHYLLSGIVAITQNKSISIVSLIGSDINYPVLRFLAKLTVLKRANSIIFVSEKLQELSGYKKKSYVIPYGVDINKFCPVDKNEAKNKLNWSTDIHYILFASRFDRKEKNSKLAIEAIDILNKRGLKCNLVEFKNISNED